MRDSCLNCRNWLRDADPIVGKCALRVGTFPAWRFQFEGEDCSDYVPTGESREAGEPMELPEPKKYPDNWTRPQILANQERIRRWHKEGKPWWWMAQMCRIPYWCYQSIPKWLAKEEVK